jgi:hypothetical protein
VEAALFQSSKHLLILKMGKILGPQVIPADVKTQVELWENAMHTL